MNDTLVIPRPIAFSEILRASDFIIVSPEETLTVGKEHFIMPRGEARNFRLTNRSNVGEVSIDMGGQRIWSHTFSENETVQLPFWKDLDAYDSLLLVFTTTMFITKPKDPDSPFSLELSFTPILDISGVSGLKHKLEYLYTLGKYEHLLVSGGACLYFKESMEELDKTSGEQFCQNFSEEERYEIYRKEGYTVLDKYKKRKTFIESHLTSTYRIEKHLIYVYTHDTDSVQKDEKLKEIASVSDYVVQTFPPALDITVRSENLEQFKTYMKEKYPQARVGEGRQLTEVNEVETARLRLRGMEKMTEQWEKILASADKVPEEITLENFRNLPEDSEYKKTFEQRRQENLNFI